MAASSRPELMHHSLTATSALMRRAQRRRTGAGRDVWSPAPPANRLSSTSPRGLLIWAAAGWARVRLDGEILQRTASLVIAKIKSVLVKIFQRTVSVEVVERLAQG